MGKDLWPIRSQTGGKQFELQAPRIRALFERRDQWDLSEWMHQHLEVIHAQLMWEFGPAVSCDGHRLVITPESQRDLRPFVREILKRAPPLAGWEFYEYRLAETIERAASTVKGRTGGDMHLLKAQAEPGEFNRVDLVFHAPVDWDHQHAFNVAYVAAESILGEEVLNRWVGAIDVTPESTASVELIDLANLQHTVQQLIRDVQASLPDQPWYQIDIENNAKWSLLERKPIEAENYPGQSDLFVCVTPVPTIVQNALSTSLFDSVRYSRFGECFCYLKIDGSAGLEHCEFADRGEIENALNAVLRPAELGSVIGGGTGLRYSYIELAITDVDAAWPSISSVLSNGRIPKSSWLLFHDADLATQWLGVYEDTPLPPSALHD